MPCGQPARLPFLLFLFLGTRKGSVFLLKEKQNRFSCTFLFERKVPKEAKNVPFYRCRNFFDWFYRLPGRILHEQVRVVARGGAREHPRNHADENQYRLFYGVSSNQTGRSEVPMMGFRCTQRKVSRICAPIRAHGSSFGLMFALARLINPLKKMLSQTCWR